MVRAAARVVALAALALAQAGCGITFPWSALTSGVPQAPSALSISPSGFDQVVVDWPRIPGVADHFRLEMRVEGGEWVEADSGWPMRLVSVDLSLLPEQVDVAFRLQLQRAGAVSAYTEARWRRGIRPPSGFAARAPTGLPGSPPAGTVALSWTIASARSAQVELMRAPDLGAARSWSFLPAPPAGATAAADTEPPEAVPVVYRIRSVAAGEVSDWVEATADGTVPLLPAVGLRAVREPGGVRVTWTARSRRATGQVLERMALDGFLQPEAAFPLPADATSYLDPDPDPWPVRRYRVATDSGPTSVERVTSAPAVIEAWLVPGPPDVRAGSVLLPWGASFARAPDGSFHVAGFEGFAARVHRREAGAWAVHDLPDGVFDVPALRVDAQGVLHTLYVVPGVTPAPPALRHDWHDGQGWRSEEVPAALPSNFVPPVDIDAAGALHVLALRTGGDAIPGDHWVGQGGSWASEAIPAPDTAAGFLAAFRVASDGTAFALYWASGSPSECRLQIRPAGGVWGATELVPGCGTARARHLIPGDGGLATVVLQVDDGLVATELWAIRRSAGGGYQVPERIDRLPPAGASLVFTSSAAGERVAFVASAFLSTEPFPDVLCARGAGASGTWGAIRLGPGRARTWTLGFGASGKVWALGGFEFGTSGPPLPHALFEEE
jgi:hypothetical protein